MFKKRQSGLSHTKIKPHTWPSPVSKIMTWRTTTTNNYNASAYIHWRIVPGMNTMMRRERPEPCINMKMEASEG